MNRIIKFRAWDKKGKKMFKVMSIDWEDIGQMVKDFENKPYFFDNVVLLQFTGLKDKNGIEIYEGDIVRYKTVSKKWSYGDIRFDNGGFIFIYKNGGYEDLRSELGKSFEVIGNVFENKDLLK